MTPEAANTIRHAADVVQWVNLVAAVLLLVIALEMGRRWKEARPYLLGPVTWGAHSVAFYIVVLFWRLPGPVVSLWSALLRLHGYLFVLAILAAVFAVGVSPLPFDTDELVEDEDE